MKYSEERGKQFETEDMICAVCDGEASGESDDAEDAANEYEAADIISAMMINGII